MLLLMLLLMLILHVFQPAPFSTSTMSVTLSNGVAMPLVGLGTWQAPPGEVGSAVSAALAAGYRHIDCAACYGNEAEVGAALAAAFAGGLKREDVFVTGKLWNSEHAAEHVEGACKQSLTDLQLEYLDLYIAHWPQQFEKVEGTTRGFPRNEDQSMRYADVPHGVTWGAMEKLVDAGLVKSIGLSNFNAVQVAAVHGGARIKPVCNQVESHPYFSQEPLIAACDALGVKVTAYSPLSSGQSVEGVTIFENAKLKEIGAKHGESAAVVAIAFQVCRGIPTFPKSIKAERIAANLAAGGLKLDEADMAAISALNGDARGGWGGPQVERGGNMEPRDLLHKDYPWNANGTEKTSL